MTDHDLQRVLAEQNYAAERKLESLGVAEREQKERDAFLNAAEYQRKAEKEVLEKSGFIMTDYILDCVNDLGNLNALEGQLAGKEISEGSRITVIGVMKEHTILIKNGRYMVIGSRFLDHLLAIYELDRFYNPK